MAQAQDILPDHYWGGEDGTVPVFKPTMDQFRSFPDFIKKIDHYGMKTGIVKVIPPQEWLDKLPDLDDKVKDIRVQSAIEQNFAGSGGAFRQMNLEKQRSYSLPQWRKICDSSEHQPPAKRGEARRVGGRNAASSRSKAQALATPPATTDSDSGSPEPEAQSLTDASKKTQAAATKKRQTAQDHVEDFNYRIDDNDQYTPERCQELERAYWKSLTFNNPMYGADLPGSLFDDDTKEWNVAHLDNILNRLGTVLLGVNSAYLYLGMWKATFSWHVEDMDLYSINYIHFGAPKQWYSVSQEDNQKFERVMKDIFPNDARHCDQFMRHKTFGASPARLAQHDLLVNKLVHYEKEFVITFPYGYHSGYNLGYNCAESVNFATEEWLEYGKVAKKCECVTDAVSIDVNDIIRAVNGTDGYDDILTPPASDDEEEETSLAMKTHSQSDRLRRTSPKKRKKGVMTKGSSTAQYKKLSDRYHGNDRPTIKKIKITMPKPPCELCSRAPRYDDLLEAGNNKRVHRTCAEFIPETSIVLGADGKETVVGMANIDKARKALKCALCKIPTGACFQCSSPKCVRAFHGTCAYDAGVLVQKVEGTENSSQAFHFLCKTHRPRRLIPELLEFDSNITQFASSLQLGSIAQAQFATGHCFSGLVRENRRSERALVLEVGNEQDMIEVDYQWILPAPKRASASMKSMMQEHAPTPPIQGQSTTTQAPSSTVHDSAAPVAKNNVAANSSSHPQVPQMQAQHQTQQYQALHQSIPPIFGAGRYVSPYTFAQRPPNGEGPPRQVWSQPGPHSNNNNIIHSSPTYYSASAAGVPKQLPHGAAHVGPSLPHAATQVVAEIANNGMACEPPVQKPLAA